MRIRLFVLFFFLSFFFPSFLSPLVLLGYECESCFLILVLGGGCSEFSLTLFFFLGGRFCSDLSFFELVWLYAVIGGSVILEDATANVRWWSTPTRCRPFARKL